MIFSNGQVNGIGYRPFLRIKKSKRKKLTIDTY